MTGPSLTVTPKTLDGPYVLSCGDHGQFTEVTREVLVDEVALRAAIRTHMDAEHPENTDLPAEETSA